MAVGRIGVGEGVSVDRCGLGMGDGVTVGEGVEATLVGVLDGWEELQAVKSRSMHKNAVHETRLSMLFIVQ